jgi:hypothetical protein
MEAKRVGKIFLSINFSRLISSFTFSPASSDSVNFGGTNWKVVDDEWQTVSIGLVGLCICVSVCLPSAVIFEGLFILGLRPNIDRLCGLVVKVPGCYPRGPGFDSRCCQIFWVVLGLERGPLSSCENKWGATWKKSSGSGLEKRD